MEVYNFMGLKNKIVPGSLYFLTMTVVDWVDVFTRPIYKHIIVDALKYCIEKKGLQLYAWCLMSNHLHIIAAAEEGKNLSDILRDFKGFTSRKIIAAIQGENESRKQWMLHRFEFSAKLDPKVRYYKSKIFYMLFRILSIIAVRNITKVSDNQLIVLIFWHCLHFALSSIL